MLQELTEENSCRYLTQCDQKERDFEPWIERLLDVPLKTRHEDEGCFQLRALENQPLICVNFHTMESTNNRP